MHKHVSSNQTCKNGKWNQHEQQRSNHIDNMIFFTLCRQQAHVFYLPVYTYIGCTIVFTRYAQPLRCSFIDSIYLRTSVGIYYLWFIALKLINRFKPSLSFSMTRTEDMCATVYCNGIGNVVN